jgi:hypothetical protein
LNDILDLSSSVQGFVARIACIVFLLLFIFDDDTTTPQACMHYICVTCYKSRAGLGWLFVDRISLLYGIVLSSSPRARACRVSLGQAVGRVTTKGALANVTLPLCVWDTGNGSTKGTTG